MASDWDISRWVVGSSTGSISTAEDWNDFHARQENGTIVEEIKSLLIWGLIKINGL